MLNTDKIKQICGELIEERHRQFEKWGKQEIPCLMPSIMKNGTSTQMTSYYGIMSEQMTKNNCDVATVQKKITFGHIATEELAEILSEFDEEKRRAEILQLAAVCVQWIEEIDARNEKNEKFNSKGFLNKLLDTPKRWVFERSSGYAGFRCNVCNVWAYEENLVCDCNEKLPDPIRVDTDRPIKNGLTPIKELAPGFIKKWFKK